MSQLLHLPEHVRNYFRHPCVQYAAWMICDHFTCQGNNPFQEASDQAEVGLENLVRPAVSLFTDLGIHALTRCCYPERSRTGEQTWTLLDPADGKKPMPTFDHGLDFRDLDDAVAYARRYLNDGYEQTGQWDLAQTCRHLSDWMKVPMDGAPQIPLLMSLTMAVVGARSRQNCCDGF